MTDLWALPPVSSPAATDRIGAATGPGAGGHIPLGNLVWKSAGGFLASGLADATYDFSTSLVVENQSFNAGSVAGLFGKTGDSSNGYLAFVRTGGYAGRFSLALNNGTGPSNLVEVFAATPTGVGIGVAPLRPLHVKSGAGESFRLETSTVRGSGNNYLGFNDPDGGKGFLGYGGANDDFYVYNTMAAQIIFGTNSTPRLVVVTSGAVEPGSDNSQPFGGASKRWKEIHAGNGSIITSDGTEKTEIRAFTIPELNAAKRIAAQIGVFQFLSSIAEKGEVGARLHSGVIAQDVWAIMADEDLIAPVSEGADPDSKYAFLCWDKWEATPAIEEARNDEGDIVVAAQPARPAGARFSIRTDQLALFLIAAQEARLAALEAAL